MLVSFDISPELLGVVGSLVTAAGLVARQIGKIGAQLVAVFTKIEFALTNLTTRVDRLEAILVSAVSSPMPVNVVGLGRRQDDARIPNEHPSPAEPAPDAG